MWGGGCLWSTDQTSPRLLSPRKGHLNSLPQDELGDESAEGWAQGAVGVQCQQEALQWLEWPAPGSLVLFGGSRSVTIRLLLQNQAFLV